MEVKVRSPNDDADFGVLQVYTFAPYVFVIYLPYVLWTSIDLIKYGFTLKKGKKLRIYSRYYKRRRLHRLSSASNKSTCQSLFLAS